jgi:hypothetical protein
MARQQLRQQQDYSKGGIMLWGIILVVAAVIAGNMFYCALFKVGNPERKE